MTTKIEIDLSNVITEMSQVKSGMHLWSVGQGGVTGVCPPRYVGQVICSGTSDYVFDDSSTKAVGFVVKDTDISDDFVTFVTEFKNDENKIVDWNIEDGKFEKNVQYPLKCLIPRDSHIENVYVISQTVLPKLYNNWYTCDSLEKAEAVYAEMQSKWTLLHEKERDSYEREMDYSLSYCNGFWDYD